MPPVAERPAGQAGVGAGGPTLTGLGGLRAAEAVVCEEAAGACCSAAGEVLECEVVAGGGRVASASLVVGVSDEMV